MTPWVKLDHSFWRQPRMRRCGVEGYALAAAALTYSADNQTDGLLSADDLDAVAHSIGLGHPTQIAERLVTEGIWQLSLEGWRIPFEDQMRAEKREQLHRHRADAGRRGGQTRARQAVRLPGGKFAAASQVTPSKPSKSQTDEEEEVEVDNPPTPRKRGERKRPRTAWPASLSLDADMRATARDAGVDDAAWQTREFRKFHAHAEAQDRRCASWRGAWRQWCLKAVEYAERDGGARGSTTDRPISYGTNVT